MAGPDFATFPGWRWRVHFGGFQASVSAVLDVLPGRFLGFFPDGFGGPSRAVSEVLPGRFWVTFPGGFGESSRATFITEI